MEKSARWIAGLGAAVFAMGLAPASVGAAQDWPIVHHEIRAAVEPATQGIEVSDVLTLASPPGKDQPLHLLLHRDLAVASATLDGRTLDVDEEDGFQPRHFWDRPDYERLADFEVAREVTILPPEDGWPGEPRVTLRYAGAVYDSLRPPEVAYGRGFETTTGLIDERGAFLTGSTFWIPWSGEHLFRYSLQTSLPQGWESVSQGTWAERRVADDGRVESSWVVDDPMGEAYLIAGPYTVREAPCDDVTAYTFTYENTPEDLCQTYLDATDDYLRAYEEMLGPYPFDKFAMVENWWQTGFGMPSFTLLGDRVIRLPFIVHTSYGHEILHNWWGNGVFVDYEGGNWCEGLTSYLADYTYKADEGEDAAREYRLTQLQGYLDYASAGGKDFALRDFTERESASTQAVGYGKTMMVYHMARRLLGEETFFDGLRRFYKDFLFREARWDDVVASFEAVSERELAGWFEQWIGRPGAPFLTVSRSHGEEGGLWIDVRQEEPLFDVRVPVHYEVDGEVRVRELSLDGRSTRMEIDADASWVAVDPEFQIFRRLHRGEIPPGLSQILGADSTVVVIGSRCSTELAAALRDLAETWSRNHDQIVVDEADFQGAAGRGVWLFGGGERVDELFAGSRSFGDAPRDLFDEAVQEGRSLVACFRDPESPEIPWTVLLPESPSVVEALGRKLPHYGRYSFLVFEDETNVDKGNWVMKSSPLRLDLTEEGS
jgi:aminopeptidase N